MKAIINSSTFWITTVLVGSIVYSEATIAQQITINQKQVPLEVIYAIQRDFPRWEIPLTKWNAVNTTKAGWTLAEAKAMRYKVKAEGFNSKSFAVYNGRGKRLSAKTVITDAEMPFVITSILSTDPDYSGWTVISNKQLIRNFDDETRHIKVKLENNGKKKTVIFANDGHKISKIAALFI